MLKADHDKVKKLFKEFERLHKADDDEAEDIATKICNELTVHTTIEEEIFYPEVRAAIDDQDLLDEAEVEHASAKELIAQIEESSPDDDKYAAKVIVLGEYINHHIEEEHKEMFPKAKRAKVDTAELGSRMAARKRQLQEEMGIAEDAGDEHAYASMPARSRSRPSRPNAGRR
jgi:hemerythrin superfamily protein